MRRLLSALVILGATAAPGTADTVRYYHLDGIGNVRAITNKEGVVVERHDYLPFGEEWCPGPPPGLCGSSPPGQPRRFTGKERDIETGFDYFGARYYASKIGRFTTVDPLMDQRTALVDPQQWNRYAYARNNPLRYVDPDGRAIETPWDVLNVGIGLASLAGNVAAGNVGGAALDAAGLVYDVAATAVPGLPGGAGTAIKAARAADKVADVVRAGDKAVDVGRAGKQARLRELAGDPSVSSADRGWIRQEMNQIDRGTRSNIRNPPGKDLAHERGREAAKGYDYKHSNLQDRSLHKTQHKYDNRGRANKERPPGQ